MSRGLEWLLCALSSRLPAAEREAVCGDLLEMQFSYRRRLCEVAGLLGRHELEAWNNWRAWIGVAAIVALVLAPLNRLSYLSIMAPLGYLHVYRKYGVLYQSGLSMERQALSWCFQTASLLLLAWAGGKAFSRLVPDGSLAAPLRILVLWTAWNSIATIRLVARGAPFFAVLLGLFIYSLFFLLPALHGASSRGRWSRPNSLALLAAAIVAVTLLTWTGGWWHASIAEMNGGYWPGEVPWYTRLWPWLLAAWPAAYLSLDSFRKEENPR